MRLNKNYIIIYYFFLYLTLIIGLYFGEDFTGGFKYDLDTHNMLVSNLFNKGIGYGLLNYDIYYVPHSPIFIIYIIFLKKLFLVDEIYRLVNLHLSLLIPIFVGLSLKIKYNLKSGDIRYLLPTIFFFSPYFRAGSIWTDDNLFAIIFLCISIYFFIKYEKNKVLKNILCCAFFLAISSYFRPIYSIFSIYFFLKFFVDLNFNRNFIYYVLFNFLLSLPALYYLFILDVNKWAINYLFRENLFTIISLVSSVLVFYFLPFILKDYKSLSRKLLNIKNIFLSSVIIILLVLFFEYNRTYSGGIILKLSNLIFNNNYLFFLISSISITLLYILFFNKKKKTIFFDIVILFLLFSLEIDGVIYHETYDPLIYILIFLIFKNNYINSFIIKLNLKKYILLVFFALSFYATAVLKTIIII